jgi:hypothetical protein
MKLENLKSLIIILAIAGLLVILKKNILRQKEITKTKTLIFQKKFAINKPQANTPNTNTSNITVKPQEQLLNTIEKEIIPNNQIHFNFKTGRCENAEGEESISENPYTECSDLSNRNLADVPFGTFVIYGNNLKNSDMSKNNIDLYALLFGEVKFDRATIFPENYGDIKNALLETNLHIIDDISIASITLYEHKNILLQKFRDLKSQYLKDRDHPEKNQELAIQMQKIKAEMNQCEDKIKTNSYKESRHKKYSLKIEEEL